MFAGHYDGWRLSRMNGLDKYVSSDFWNNKTLFELGAGHSDIGFLFHQKGCKVTSSDIREEHLSVAKSKYPQLNIIKFDCDKDIINTHYDIILHWGVLYHINNIETNIENVCNMCDYLILETEVCVSDDIISVKVNEGGYDQAFHSIGTRPSEKYVEQLLSKNGFEFKLIKDPILNSSIHKYDWDTIQGFNINMFNHGYRRYWICWRNDKPSPVLIKLN